MLIKAHVRFSANETVEAAEKKLLPVLIWLRQQPEITMSSVTFGSEAGVLSMGSGSLPAEAVMTINCVNRFERQKSIWQMEDEIRARLNELPGVKAADVYDFGATAMSSIRAPVDVRLLAEDYHLLSQAATGAVAALGRVKGLTSINTSWAEDFTEARLEIDPNKALFYDMTPAMIAAQLPLSGAPVAISGNLVSMQSQFVRLNFASELESRPDTLRLIPIRTPRGTVPLETLATISYGLTANKIERSQLLYSLDVSGYRAKRPMSTIMADVEKELGQEDFSGVTLSQEGDSRQMQDSFSRMLKAIAIGIVLLLMALIAIYHSVRLSLVMILVLPLAMIGASWGMLVFNKPSCMPSMVGIMLLFGIIIKNSVLLIDFYQQFRKTGESPFAAALESVRVRFRPVFMTAFGTMAG